MLKDFIEIIQKHKSVKWQSKLGLLVYPIVIFGIEYSIIFALDQIELKLGTNIKIYILLISQVIYLASWLLKRTLFYDADILTVAFAISTDKKTKNYYKELKQRFNDWIQLLKLENIIKLKELPDIPIFKSNKDAEKFIIENGIRLLIWGNTYEESMVKNEPFVKFNVKFSYQYSYFQAKKKSTEKKYRKVVKSKIDKAAQRKYWGIWRPNSAYQLEIVSGNIIEISLFIVGFCLATMPDFSLNYLRKAIKVFEKLEKLLKTKKQDDNLPNLNQIRDQVRSMLIKSCEQCMDIYWNHQRDLENAIKYAEKIIKLDENNFGAHQNLAPFKWKKGEQDAARYHTKRAWKISPGHPLTRFNRGFLYFYDKNFKSGLNQYKKIKTDEHTNILNVVEFIEEEFEQRKDNLGLLFAAVWLNIKFADLGRGVKQLNKFLVKAKNQDEYSFLINEAEKLLRLPELKIKNL
ncbi:hypothetical protein CL633_02645 [bacterium]|nr:hypothetical protein [bacterium]|tara:strand:- start:958 stop:2343 length:1386 start_codon:yes stop_codon:yes gene_type:complete